MLTRFTLFFAALISMATSLSAAVWDDRRASSTPPQINVLIVHDQVGVVLEVKGRYKIYDPNTNKHLTTRFSGKRKFIQAVRDGIKWGEEFPGIYQLVIVPDEASTTTIVDGIEYKGPIYVYDIGGTISVVNRVSIEDYLSQILSHRYKQEQSQEVLAALVITARTAAYYRVANPKNQFWSVDAKQVGYQGIPLINPTSPIEQAIKATRYMIMSKSSDRQVLAFLAEWLEPGETPQSAQAVVSQISTADANTLAQKGENAAQILSKAFPGTKIELIHYSKE